MAILIIILLVRFFFDWQLAAKFQPGQKIKLNFCLSNQPYYSRGKQVFYYQNHFRRIKIEIPAKRKLDSRDCLEIIGEIRPCPEPSKVRFCLLNPAVSVFSPDFSPRFLGGKLIKKIHNFRGKLTSILLKKLPYPQADLLAGVVLGVKQNLDPEFYQQLRRTGTLHIIVASGYNLSVTGESPVNCLAYLLGIKPAIFLGFFLIWFYVGLVGFEPPVLRAAIMLSFLFLARLIGKRFDQWRALGAATWLMLMVKPDLIASVSFQLSEAAILGLMVSGEKFTKLAAIPLIGKDLAETLSAQIMVAPLIAWHFGRTSWLAPLTNALTLPLVPIIMKLGLVGLLIWPALWLVYPLLWWVVLVVEKFSNLPFVESTLSLVWWQALLSYLIIGFWLRRSSVGEKKKKTE